MSFNDKSHFFLLNSLEYLNKPIHAFRMNAAQTNKLSQNCTKQPAEERRKNTEKRCEA